MEKVQIVANAIVAAMPLTWPNASAQDALDAINQISRVKPMTLLELFSEAEKDGAVSSDLWKLFDKETSDSLLGMFVASINDGNYNDCVKIAHGAESLGIFSIDTKDAVISAMERNAMTFLQEAFLSAQRTEEEVSIIDTQVALNYLSNGEN